MPDFELIFEFGQACAAILPERLRVSQLRTIYALLPESANYQPELAGRWGVATVLSSEDWAREQLRRVPMLKPHGTKLSFLNS